MANIKFSAFTQKVDQANVDFLVGYTGTDNVRIAPSTIGQGVYVLKAGDTMTGALQMGASFSAQIPINFGDTNFQISTENNYTAANLDNLKFKVPDAATGGFRFTNANDDEIFFAQGDGKIGINTVTPQTTLDVNLGVDSGVGASFGGTISSGEYQGIHFGYSEKTNANYKKSAIVFERDDATGSATANAQGNIYILNNINNNSGSATLADQRMKISKNTNVGIGEDLRPLYPEAKLTINSNPLNNSQPDRITTSVVDSHTGLFLNGTGNAINEKYGLQFGWYSGYSTGGIFVVGDNVAGSTSGDMTFDMGNGTGAGSLVERMRLTHEGVLMLGTTSPSSNTNYGIGDLNVENDLFASAQIMSHNSTAGNYSFLGLGKSSGTSASPTIVQANEIVGTINYYGYDGAAYKSLARISASVDGTPGAGVMPGKLEFWANSNSASASPTKRMVIEGAGNVGIGISDPVAKLHVYQNNSDDDTSAGVTIEQDGTGDAALSFLLSGVRRWRLGIDNNDSDKFKISDSTNLATSNKLTIDVDGNVGIGTDAPSELLELKPAAGTDAKIRCLKSDGSEKAVIGYDNGNGALINLYNEAGTKNVVVRGYGDSYFNGGNLYVSKTAADFAVVGAELRSNGQCVFTADGDNSLDLNRLTNDGAIAVFRKDGSVIGTIGSNTTGGNPLLDIAGATGSSNIRFLTTNTERMRITDSGVVGIGTDGPFSFGAGSESGVFIQPTSYMGISIPSSTTSALILRRLEDGSLIRFYNSTTTAGNISVSGSSTVYATSSDYRLKEDLKDFDGLDKVSKIPVYDFKWKVDDSRSYGVMAHELQEVLPDAVSGEKDAEEMQGVDYSKIVPLLIKSIQELEAKVKELENK